MVAATCTHLQSKLLADVHGSHKLHRHKHALEDEIFSLLVSHVTLCPAEVHEKDLLGNRRGDS